jgi:lipopolysaccharide/colanic/teichoic acid biosynthesis glycosyltransferase
MGVGMLGDFTEAHSPDIPVEVQYLQPAGARRRAYLLTKRSFDIIAVLLIAPIALPLVSVLAVLVRLGGGPAFYSQMRLGMNGRAFKFWKLRSMVPDAEQRLEQYLRDNPEARLEWDEAQKLKSDPRITPLGRYLRKYSLDELPQLWNVFIGDMSLVGPRPMFPEQRVLYPGTHYFAFRPGMTGLWQISERNGCSFADRAKHDTRYAENLSFAQDLHILVRTVGVVFRGTGY